MQIFLQCLLSLTVGGSLMALLVWLLSKIQRLPRSFCYYAWVLVLLRLALPLPGALELSAPQIPAAGIPVQTEAPSPVVWETEPLNQASDPMPKLEVTPPNVPEHSPGTSALEEIPRQDPTVWQLLGAVWLAGFAWGLGRDLYGYGRFRRALKKTLLPPRPSDLEHYAPGAGWPRLLRSVGIDSPMLLGLVQPVLLLPDRDYTPEVLRCIFSHELTHFRRGDILLKWLAMPVLAAHWFNPLTVLIRREFSRCCELSCDERILKTMDDHQRRCYGQTLLLLAQGHTQAGTALSTSFSIQKKHLKERLVQIMNFHPKSKWILALTALLLAAVVLTCILLGPAREEEPVAPSTEPTTVQESTGGDLRLDLQGPLYTYTGDSVYIQGSLHGSSDHWEGGIGLLLLLDGHPQPYRTGDNENLLYMHTFLQPGDLEVMFDPVAGHEGETLDLAMFTIKNPNRPTEQPIVPLNHSADTVITMTQVKFLTEPGEVWVPDVPRMAGRAKITLEDASRSDYRFRFSPGPRLDGMQKFQAKASGPAGAQMSYVIYLNNQPASWETFFALEGQQRTVLDTTLDLSQVQGSAMIYAVLYGKNPNDPSDPYMEVSGTCYITAPRKNSPVSGNAVQTNAVVVSDVDEFLEAIGPDTIIVMEPGVYDLSTASSYGQQNISDYYRWDQVKDGYGLTIRDVDNLHIQGGELVTQSRYAPVLEFVNCTDSSVMALTAGHTDGVEGCRGAVFQLTAVDHFIINNCDLYGCGTYGVVADQSQNITVSFSTIRDCSQGAAQFLGCVNTFLYENKIQRIGKPGESASDGAVPAALFRFDTSSKSGVIDCHITDSVAQNLLISDHSQQIYCLGNTGNDLNIQNAVYAHRSGTPTVDGCEFSFQGKPAWIDKVRSDTDYVFSAQGEKLYGQDLDEMKYHAYSVPSAAAMQQSPIGTRSEQERLERALALLEASS